MGAVFSKPLLATTCTVTLVVGRNYPECMCQMSHDDWCAKKSNGLDNDCDGVDDDCDGIHDKIYRQLMGHDKARPGTITWMDENKEEYSMKAIVMEYEVGSIPDCPNGSFPLKHTGDARDDAEDPDEREPCQDRLDCQEPTYENYNECKLKCENEYGGQLSHTGKCKAKRWVVRTSRFPHTGEEIMIPDKDVIEFGTGSDVTCQVTHL